MSYGCLLLIAVFFCAGHWTRHATYVLPSNLSQTLGDGYYLKEDEDIEAQNGDLPRVTDVLLDWV